MAAFQYFCLLFSNIHSQLAYENGFSRQNMFIIIAVLHVLVLVSTFFFLPKDFISRPEPRGVPQSEVANEEEAGIELIKKNEHTGI